MNDDFFMQLALDIAWKYQLLTYPNPAVGAVVTLDGKILSVEAHQKAGTSHAEVLALLSAYETLSQKKIDFNRFDAQKAHTFLRTVSKDFFSACSIYVTLEPCAHEGKTPSCASLLELLNLKRVIIGMKDPIAGHDKGAERLKHVTFGICEKECEALLEPFIIWQKRTFILFKLAQTTNGRIGGGYLSSKASLTHVHKIREVCDTLLIGGNTVREDRPTLDCRFTNGNAPNIIIYTKNDNLDREIPLFHVQNRDVSVKDRLDFLQKPGFIMVEGGEGMLKVLKEKIDWILFYQTPKLSTNDLSYNIDMKLAFLHQVKIDVDLMIWSRHLGD